MRRTLDAAAPLLVSRKIQLDSELGDNLPPVAGDADHLQQVFLNLINNALDAMPRGGALRVTAGWEAARREIAVEFADNGHGMTPEVRARIFDALYTTKERGRGTGLGLSIVRQLVQEHGGRVEVESEPEQGTKVRVFLPVESGSKQVRKSFPV